ncbi:hypothetical protein DFH09DRAFT_1084844 [Mycena vulgaris]|nr:hypothetical protein DFH09DRAFT_1084844 [Mycena vulgaris]
MKLAFVTLTAAATLTAVESLLSSSDPGLQCLAPSALNNFLSLRNTPNVTADVVKNTVDQWATAFCGVGSCSSDTISRIVSNVTAACGSVGDASKIDASTSLPTTANKFCISESIKPAGISGAAPELMLLGLILASGDTGATCNDCTKARYQLKVQAGDSSTDTISGICGADFTATLNSTVAGVSQVAVGGEVKSTKNGAGTLALPAGLLLVAVSGLFGLL